MNIVTRIFDICSQEGCDCEPYNTLQEAGELISKLEAKINDLNTLISGFNNQNPSVVVIRGPLNEKIGVAVNSSSLENVDVGDFLYASPRKSIIPPALFFRGDEGSGEHGYIRGFNACRAQVLAKL